MDDSNQVIVILIIIIIILALVLGFKIINKSDDNMGVIEVGSKIKEGASEGLDTLEEEMQKWNSYNKTYEKYKGEQFSNNIRELLDTVKNHNFLYAENRKVIVEYEGKQYVDSNSIDNLKSLIKNGNVYIVSLEYDSKTKLVNKVIIE